MFKSFLVNCFLIDEHSSKAVITLSHQRYTFPLNSHNIYISWHISDNILIPFLIVPSGLIAMGITSDFFFQHQFNINFKILVIALYLLERNT